MCMHDQVIRSLFRRYIFLVGGCAIGVAILIALSYAIVALARHLDVFHTAESYQNNLSYLEDQIQAVRDGKQDSVYLYGTENTDELLTHLRGLDNLRSLSLDTTDASSKGMSYLRCVPGLRTLVISCGRGMDDKAIEELAGHATLERLSLMGTRITDKGIEGLTWIPHLRELTVCDNSTHPKTTQFTENGLKKIADISSLERVTVSWNMREIISYLKEKRPDLEFDYECSGVTGLKISPTTTPNAQGNERHSPVKEGNKNR